MSQNIKRNRIYYALFILIVILLGLMSRFYDGLPPLILPYTSYIGDTLWALMVYLIMAHLFPTHSPIQILLWTFIFAWGIEFSQLYQAPWINELRQNPLIALVLGRGFIWSDLVCYTAGALIGFFTETLWFKWLQNTSITLDNIRYKRKV